MKDVRSRLATASLVAGAMIVGTASFTQAATLDCSVTAGSCVAAGTVIGGNTYYSFAGALWTTTDFGATGTGVINTFLSIQDNPTESGMNTSYRPVPQDENNSLQVTHDLVEGAVPIVTLSGVNYYEFFLDINEPNSDASKVSLVGLELCSNPTGLQTIAANATTCAGSNFYSLGDNVVAMDDFYSGSGSGDLFVYIPVPAAGIPDSNFIYLYSRFGPTPPANAGFEEWSVRTAAPTNTPVPEPASMLLFGTGLAGLVRAARRKNRKATA